LVARGERRQNIARLREIGEVAARHGFGMVLDPRRRSAPAADVEIQGRNRGQRLRDTLDELGPTFVKFGQLLSTRPDIVPPDVIKELRTLQDAASPVPAATIRAAVESELGLRIDQVFEEFDDVPLASASIGQVHRARLPEGREVVVKVQRPEAEETLKADISLLDQIARISKERVKRLEFIDTVALVDEFRRTIRQELDYGIEARNVEAARRAFTGDATVTVPTVYWRYSSSKVLVLEWLDGGTLTHTDLDSWTSEDRRRLAARVSETWMKMIFVHGFFHADPHPANIVVQGPNRIGLIDFGMVWQLSPRDRQAAVHLFIDIVDQNLDRLPRRLRDLGLRYPKEQEEEFRDQLGVLLQRHWGAAMGEIDGRELVRDIFQTIYRLQIKLPSRWVLLDKALATLAGVGLEISPEFNVFETARPYARRLMAQRYRPDVMFDRVQKDLGKYAEAMLAFPFQLHDLMDEFRDGEVKIAIQQEGFTESTERALGATNRVVMGLLAAALFMGSAIIGGFVRSGPHVAGVAAIAIPGLIVGAVIAGMVLFGIIRSGRW
jgi:ubiquinone biosynthesis protein